MKKLLFILPILCFAQILLAQVPKNLEDPAMEAYFSNKENVPVLRGRLLNVTKEDADTLMVQYVLVQPSAESQVHLYTELKPDGSFEIKLPYAIPNQQIWLMMPFSFIEVILNRGLYIEGDLKKMREVSFENQRKNVETYQFSAYGLKFSGPDAEVTRMKNMYSEFDYEKQQEAYRTQNMVLDRKKDFVTRINALKQADALFQEVETRFLEHHSFECGWILANERKSSYYTWLLVSYHGRKWPQGDTLTTVLAHQPALLSNDGRMYYSSLSSLRPVGKLDNLGQKIKDLNMSSIKTDLAMLIGGTTDTEWRKAYIGEILPLMSSNWIKQIAQDELANKEKLTQQINERLEKVVVKNQKAGPGRLFAELDNGARLYLNESKNADSLIQKIRAMYPGEAVIFDLWATWCGPCIEDMKNSKAKKEELKKLGVNVVYLGVESRSSEEAWKKKIIEYSFTGDHIWLGPAGNTIMSQYGLSGFPSYLFFDRKGKYHPRVVHFIQHLDLEEIKKLL
jgi:thiol-disulfide isomerase/thioredoxin